MTKKDSRTLAYLAHLQVNGTDLNPVLLNLHPVPLVFTPLGSFEPL